jgi:hypothetical protein
VLWGQKSWVGYIPVAERFVLPKLKPGVLTPADAVPVQPLGEATEQRLNFFYAKDYKLDKDAAIVLKAYRELGRQ